MAKCDGWCAPTLIYLVLAVMSLLATMSMHFRDPEIVTSEAVIMSVLYKIFWAGVLYLLCSTCHDSIAWLVLLVPLIFGLLAVFLIFTVVTRMASDARADRRHRR